jgi:hypothetical protein
MKLPAWAVLALSAAGCSLIIPLDYTGGVGGSSGSGATHAGNGGNAGAGNAPQGGTSQGAEAGVGDEGGNPQGGGGPEAGSGGSSSPGGTDTGGHGGTTGGTDGGTSGTSGGLGGSSMGGEEMGGEAGTGAAGTSGGGVGGSGGAVGGRGGRGGMSGMSGTAGCSFDITSNPMHCGSCTKACPSGDECIDSKCVSSPCDQLGCTSVQMPINNGDGPRKENLGTGDVCVEVLSYTPNPGYLPGISCWNFGNGRVTEVNDVAIVCGQGDKELPMPKRKGGYCFHAGPGESASAGFVMPYAPSPLCCTAPNGGTGGT